MERNAPTSSTGRNKKSRRQRRTQKEAASSGDLLERFERTMLLHDHPQFSHADFQEVAAQLGYLPLNFIEVVARTAVIELDSENSSSSASSSQTISSGRPQVAMCYPLNRNDCASTRYKLEDLRPFPTFLWMTCQKTSTLVSYLEECGYISILQDRLDKDEYAIQRMEDAHMKYAMERYSLLTQEHIELVESMDWIGPLKEKGIAGIQNFRAVKCLHCHYSHYLARPEHGNIIGEWVDQLIKSGVAVKNTAGQGDIKLEQTGLHHDAMSLLNACHEGRVEVATTLISNGSADITAVDNEGKTALHLVCVAGYKELAKVLLDSDADTNATDENGRTPLHLICSRHVRQAHSKMIVLLLERGASVFIADADQRTPLHLASMNSASQCKNPPNATDTIIMLLKSGADVNAQDRLGYTPLHWACLNGNVIGAKNLLDYGAKISAIEENGNTPLHLTRSEEVSKLLLQRGADAWLKNRYDLLPDVTSTKPSSEICERLWCTTKLMSAMCTDDMQTFQLLLEDVSYDVNEDIGNGMGWSILHAGAFLGRVLYVALLVQSGRMNATSFFGRNVEEDIEVTLSSSLSSVTETSLNCRKNKKQTALQIACSQGHVGVVQALQELLVIQCESTSTSN